MKRTSFEKAAETAWCPGCGNHSILEALRVTLDRMRLKPHEVLIAAGIGQAAKLPQYLNANAFCGLHGRALPPAAAAKIVNPALTVIIDTGDGDSYGEGGNHTKGQASPTTDEGQITETQPLGVHIRPLNPIAVALAAGAGFVARAFSGDMEHLSGIMEQAIRHRGYSLVDILQPCVSFNKANTYEWYKKRVYALGKDHDRTDFMEAMRRAIEWGEHIPIGVIYEAQKPVFGDHLAFLKDGPPMVDRKYDPDLIQRYIRELM
jgi:2-oxoglutarate ferredoxin oxidoreductase subunit beta